MSEREKHMLCRKSATLQKINMLIIIFTIGMQFCMIKCYFAEYMVIESIRMFQSQPVINDHTFTFT